MFFPSWRSAQLSIQCAFQILLTTWPIAHVFLKRKQNFVLSTHSSASGVGAIGFMAGVCTEVYPIP